MADDSNSVANESITSHMHVVDLASEFEESSSLEALLERTADLWPEIYGRMTPRETLWVFTANYYADDGTWPVPMALADRIREEADFTLKNIVTRYRDPTDGGDLRSSYEEILFLVKDKRQYFFDKDPIRIAHVYEGNEWGGERETGRSAYHDTEVRRYNPDGKDPGNVWLEEVRTGTEDQTVDETRPLPRIEAFKRCLRAGSTVGETVYLWVGDESFEDAVTAEGRELATHPSAVIDP